MSLETVVILAAGEGTRMKSKTPKVLHTVAGRSLLGHVIAACEELQAKNLRVVVGSGREQVEAHLSEIAPPHLGRRYTDAYRSIFNSTP